MATLCSMEAGVDGWVTLTLIPPVTFLKCMVWILSHFWGSIDAGTWRGYNTGPAPRMGPIDNFSLVTGSIASAKLSTLSERRTICNSDAYYSDRIVVINSLGRTACIAPMRPIATSVTRSVVGVFACYSMCPCVSYTDVLRKNDWTDRDAVWGVGSDLCGPKKPCIRWSRDPPREGQFLGLSAPSHWKALGISAVVYSAQGSFSPPYIHDAAFRQNSSIRAYLLL